MPNSTFHAKRCKAADGKAPATAEPQVDAGELYNGMVLPDTPTSASPVTTTQIECPFLRTLNLTSCLAPGFAICQHDGRRGFVVPVSPSFLTERMDGHLWTASHHINPSFQKSIRFISSLRMMWLRSHRGENNLNQCLGPNGVADGRTAPGGGPRSCGVVSESTGYACNLAAMLEGWRVAWRVKSPAELPVGVVTLAGGTDEGQPYSMPSMRYAQTGNRGFLPAPGLPATFMAQAFDLGDPCSQMSEDGFPSGGDGRCCSNHLEGGASACDDHVQQLSSYSQSPSCHSPHCNRHA